MAGDNAKAFFAYQREINTVMQQRFGVTYSEVKNDLHDDNQLLKTSFDKGVGAADLAQEIGYQSGFKSVDEKGTDYATGYNRMKAALLQFASEDNQFRRGNEGTLFLPYDGGVATLYPVHKDDSNRWAFRAELRDGATLTPSMLEIVNEGVVRESFDGWDIEASTDWVQRNVVAVALDASSQSDEEELASPGFYR